MNTHLKFLAFVLQEGVLYLPWHRARDIWDCLVANADACEFDREVSWPLKIPRLLKNCISSKFIDCIFVFVSLDML